MVELIKGCEVNVVTPLKLEVEVAVPILIEPVVKLPPMFMSEVTELAFMTFTKAVDIFNKDTFAVKKV
jgi:hypothetical protein